MYDNVVPNGYQTYQKIQQKHFLIEIGDVKVLNNVKMAKVKAKVNDSVQGMVLASNDNYFFSVSTEIEVKDEVIV